MEHSWTYERVASGGEANGEICIFCKQRLVNETQPGQWVLKAVEDNQDADFVTETGYAHRTCSDERVEASHRGRFAAPPIPDLPGQ